LLHPEDTQLLNPEDNPSESNPPSDGQLAGDQYQFNPEDGQFVGEEGDASIQPVEGMEVVDKMKRRSRLSKVPEVVSLRQLPPLGTSPELDADNRCLFNAFVKRGRLPDPSLRTQLIQYIQRQKVNSIVAQKFEEAQNYQNILLNLQKSISDQDVKDRNQQRIETLDGKLGNTNGVLSQLQKETNQRLKEEVENQNDRRRQLQARQDGDLDVFEDHWNDRDFLKKFAKPSPQLLQLKNVERSMILTKMFDQAAIIRKKVTDMEKEESQLAQQRATVEMDKERRKLLAKHELELQAFEQHCIRQLNWIRHEQELKMAAVQARQVKLESELDDWKMNPPTALPPMASAIPELQHQAVMTPRTAQRYSVFKKYTKPPVITVKPLGSVKPRRTRPNSAVSRSLE
jgi:hypothetical protein